MVCVVLAGCVGSVPGNGGPGSATLDCATYCSDVMTNCTGSNAQYTAMANCMGACATFPMGTGSDTGGNTLGCRIYHANMAVADAATHCKHAGPGGAGGCGMDCNGFCSIVVAECPTQWNNTTCTNAQNGCPSFTSVPPYKAPSTGNTLECRLYHATMAASDPVNHCSHTLKISTQCM